MDFLDLPERMDPALAGISSKLGPDFDQA
jgi:hypothetical protein